MKKYDTIIGLLIILIIICVGAIVFILLNKPKPDYAPIEIDPNVVETADGGEKLKASKGGGAVALSYDSNVVIDTISFNVESMSSPEDGEKAFDAFVDRFKQIGAKQGISINGTANRF